MENLIEPQIINVDWLDRWKVYHRLKELEIECSCKSNEPLKVSFQDSQAAIQIWSVAKQCTANRQELINWLHQCWTIKSY